MKGYIIICKRLDDLFDTRVFLNTMKSIISCCWNRDAELIDRDKKCVWKIKSISGWFVILLPGLGEYRQYRNLGTKGRICHCVKWQIRTINTKIAI